MANTVFVVTDGGQFSPDIFGIFSTRDAADKWIAHFGDGLLIIPEVVETPLDPLSDKLHGRLHRYRVKITASGRVVRVELTDAYLCWQDTAPESYSKWEWQTTSDGHDAVRFADVVVWAADIQSAVDRADALRQDALKEDWDANQ